MPFPSASLKTSSPEIFNIFVKQGLVADDAWQNLAKYKTIVCTCSIGSWTKNGFVFLLQNKERQAMLSILLMF